MTATQVKKEIRIFNPELNRTIVIVCKTNKSAEEIKSLLYFNAVKMEVR